MKDTAVGRTRPKDWIILRMAASRTLAVTTSLKAAGFEVWTPMETVSRRRPRSRATAARKVPAMPTYCFARSRHLLDLAAEAISPTSNHPQFSVMQYNDRVVFVSDENLDPLRYGRQQARGKKAKPDPVWTPGEEVRMTEGPFAGMSGIVEADRGKLVLICFPGFRTPIKVSASLLLSDVIGGPSQTPSAEAA